MWVKLLIGQRPFDSSYTAIENIPPQPNLLPGEKELTTHQVAGWPPRKNRFSGECDERPARSRDHTFRISKTDFKFDETDSMFDLRFRDFPVTRHCPLWKVDPPVRNVQFDKPAGRTDPTRYQFRQPCAFQCAVNNYRRVTGSLRDILVVVNRHEVLRCAGIHHELPCVGLFDQLGQVVTNGDIFEPERRDLYARDDPVVAT